MACDCGVLALLCPCGQACLQVVRAHALPTDLHAGVERALRVLKRESMFKKDIVWVNGTQSMTRVSRALLGQPGMTYRYKVCRGAAFADARAHLRAVRVSPDRSSDSMQLIRPAHATRACACFRIRGRPRQTARKLSARQTPPCFHTRPPSTRRRQRRWVLLVLRG